MFQRDGQTGLFTFKHSMFDSLNLTHYYHNELISALKLCSPQKNTKLQRENFNKHFQSFTKANSQTKKKAFERKENLQRIISKK